MLTKTSRQSVSKWLTCLLESLPLAILWRLPEGTGGGRIWPDGALIPASNLWDDPNASQWCERIVLYFQGAVNWTYRTLCTRRATLCICRGTVDRSIPQETNLDLRCLPDDWGNTHTHTQWLSEAKPSPLHSPAAQTCEQLTSCWTKAWCPGPSQRRCCAAGSLWRTKGKLNYAQ